MLSIPFQDMQPESFFVGRTKELERLVEYTSKKNSVTVITGVGGIGKTSLLRMFEREYSNLFSGGIYHLSAHIGCASILNEISILKQSFETQALVVIDDAELLKLSDLNKVKDFLCDTTASLVIAGRMVVLEGIENILPLSGLNAKELLHLRSLHYKMKNEIASPDIDKVINFIEGNPLLLKLLLNTPRKALEYIHKKSNGNDENVISNNDNLKVNIQSDKDLNVDYISLIFGFILFLISYASSLETEEKLTLQLLEFEKYISQELVLESKDINNPHYSTTFLNVRKEPNPNVNNILIVLSPNQVVNLLLVKNQWAQVEFTNLNSSEIFSGWVHTKYISPIVR
ncbi:hypothetical protein EGC86_13595 [Shewanella frigidimarina]|uniref:SH3 domain-containing protein n=1 Tax=Shewanella frigidimarina TaxID=56812 RepID=UPI000F4DBC50|nr:SH3 domain-containing protein [Shewanella frigidimarina]RPA62053.1 hypothetical protein EGC86_13595 [Shewanella frigidimarina]